MDIVYPLKRTATNKELLYSLRSLSNIQHDKVFIIGDLPSFPVANIHHIPTKPLDSRYATTTNNIKVACQCKDLSDDFILMNDDFYFLKPIKPKDLSLDRGPLREQVQFYIKNHKNLTNYDRNIQQTYIDYKEICQNDARSFELHCPIIINKHKFLSILGLFKSESAHCCKRTIYGNKFITNSKTISDVKVLSYNYKELDLENMSLLSTARGIFNKVEPFLKEKFPNKSIYEV